MEEQQNQSLPEEEASEPVSGQSAYQPRPRWQVWGARIALVVFIALIIMYYVNIARGGV